MPTIAETVNKVNEFANLPGGWHFGEGVRPSELMLLQAITFLSVAQGLGLERANAFPGVDGQVQLTFYRGERVLELTLETDVTVTIAEDEDDNQIAFRERASIDEAYAALSEFSDTLWPFSDQFIVNTTIQSVRVSPAWHSTFTGMNQFPWSSAIAPLLLAAPLVGILQHSIASSLVSHPFSGISLTRKFRLAAASSGNEVPLGTIVTTISTVGAGSKHEKSSSD